MANELQLKYPTSGLTLYTQLLSAVGQIWNTATPGFEAITAANWTNYKLAAAEATGTGYYLASMPVGLQAGTYDVVWYVQGGGSPATTDSPVSGGQLQWDGTKEIPLSGVTVAVNNDKTGYSLSTAGMPVISGSVSSVTPGTTSFAGSAGLSSADGFYTGAYLAFTSGALQGIARQVTGYTGSSKTFTFTNAFPASPAYNDSFDIIGGTQ